MNNSKRFQWIALKNSSVILFVLLFVIFGILAPRFFTVKNFENIMYNSSYLGILAIGMTFALLTGGIDLSVGSNMYLSAVIAGVAINNWGFPVWSAFLIALVVGIGYGAFNGFAITKLKLAPFLVTLSTLLIGRGIGLFITKSYPVNYPDAITMMGGTNLWGFMPIPVLILLVIVAIAWVILNRTQFGRQIYAIGNDSESAEKAGINVTRTLFSVYVLVGLLAALGGFVSIGQIGRLQPNFGDADELDAIAAAVLGGSSLFGGIGSVFPGTLLGAVMIQMIQAGLVFVDIGIYVEPIVMAAIIFFAVFTDSVRNRQIQKLQRRYIRKQE